MLASLLVGAGPATSLKGRRPASIGRSTAGPRHPLLYLTAWKGSAIPWRNLGASAGPSIWLIGQSTEEPAGGEAMLALASALDQGRADTAARPR